MPKIYLNQKGIIIQVLVVILLLVGIVAGFFLLKNPQIFKSKASNPPIVVKNSDGTVNTPDASGIVQITDPTVKLEFTSPLGPARASASPSPSPSPSPTPSPSASPAR